MKTIWHNAVFYTMQNEGHTIEALLTENSKILTTGSYEELRIHAAQEIDLQGAVVFPGFIDNHMHIIGQGEKLLRLDLSQAASSEELMQMLRGAYRNLREDEWFIGEGWDEQNFPDKKIPTRCELDSITDSPMLLKRTCWHAAVVNSKALELAGITKDTPDPEDGVIERDESGEPTGLLKESAMHRVLQLLPEPSESYVTKALRTSVDHLLSVGLTGVVTDDLGYYGSYQTPLQAFKNVLGGECKFRVHLLRHFSVFQQLMDDRATYNEPWAEPGEMKFFIDGAFGGSTALLSSPYADEPDNIGTTVVTDEELEELVKLARTYGEAVAIHMIGDQAVEKALDVIEKHPAPAGKRDRFIHVCLLRDDLVNRMAKLPIVLDIQPAFVPSDFPWIEDRLGTHRMNCAYAWKRLIDRAFIVGGGSDAPIEDPSPLLGMHAAIERRQPGDQHDGYLPNEKLSRYEAVQLFTSGAAATIGKTDSRGRIAEGFDADFTILSEDLFTVPVDRIPDIPIYMTVVAGEIMYRASEKSGS
ncbi:MULTISPECIES: amidohydrolase [Sporosarcina]|uniref:amidohydrolase n=1 Tax=Sporosarcina TaxID=1569 RepID=UPI00129B45CF|nr:MULTISPECIES: amidohydrolase [Sporosarcina]GKV65000.1 putative amidohydrolase YtcJ [Sporosarcina sp. NCCP-2331]GLB56635.1 putative amidohydrolase YtcJ [Sporosarcina sp. NCCP-2378]